MAQRARHNLIAATAATAAPGRGRAALVVLASLALGAALSACSGGGSINIANSQAGDPATLDYPIFYVKRTVPLNAAGNLVQDDLRIINDAVAGADLYKRSAASPSALETNITARITAGAMYDVKDVDASADGSMVVFAMRGPLAKNQNVRKPPSWRIWTYTIATDTLSPMIDPAVDPDPPTVQDVSPHFLPDGRVVFSTTRQDQSQGVLLNEHKPAFLALDEQRQEEAFVLEVMTPGKTDIHQITFNQSHDRDATVLVSGRVLWSRWDDTNGHNAMSLYSANPDGTDLELYYGADSHMTGTNNTVVEFSHPKEMQDGSVMVLARQFTGVDDGGDLVMINGVQYVENTAPYPASNTNLKGPAQSEGTTLNVTTIPGPSPGGRFNSASPLWDGSNRILVSWSECRLLDQTTTPPTVVPCNATTLAAPNPVTAPPAYSVWMFDPSQNTLLPITAPVTGIMVTDVVATQPRPLPHVIPDQVAGVTLDQNLVAAGVGVIDIRSVYDIDGVDIANPNIATVADPGQTPVNTLRPRFIRLVKAVSIPDHKLDATLPNLSPAAFGASNFMREILGYAPIEPDGSVRIEVPAQVAFEVSLLDVNARRYTADQGVWLQLQPGEVVNCNGCHSPQQPGGVSHGRAGTFTSAWAGAAAAGVPFPHTYAAPPKAFLPQQAGQTMAEARMAWSCANDTPPCLQMVPSVNVLYTDVWSDPAQVPAANIGTSITYAYAGATYTVPQPPTSALCQTAWSADCRIIINYPEHIQPIWDAVRPDPVNAAISRTCTQGGCHNPLDAAGAAQMPAGNLDLTNSACSQTPQQLTSYCQLLFAHNIVVNMVTQSVGPFMTAGTANGGASPQFFAEFAPNGTHSTAGTSWLNVAELRLISEWLDIGAQYFNNPFDPAVPVN
jgi:hypothetical protein